MGGNLLKYDVSEYLPHRIESHPIFLDANNFAMAAARPFQPKDDYHRVVIFNHELQFVEYQLWPHLKLPFPISQIAACKNTS